MSEAYRNRKRDWERSMKKDRQSQPGSKTNTRRERETNK